MAKDSKYSIDKLNELHPKFIKAIKETSPLAVLSSLCIAVSAFTNQSFPDAQPFAITAAILFLISFSSSIIFKILNGTVYAPLFSLTSFVTTTMAIIMLFGALYYFGTKLPLVSDTVSAILPIMLIIFSVVFGLFYWEVKAKLRIKLQSILPFYFQLGYFILIVSILGLACAGIIGIIQVLGHFPDTFYLLPYLQIRSTTLALLDFFAGANFLFFFSLRKASKLRKEIKDPADELDSLPSRVSILR